MSTLAIYMRPQSGHAQFEFTKDQFSRDAVHNATQQYIFSGHTQAITVFSGRTQDITVYLSH